MKKEAKYEARCADCGLKIAAGESMDYSPPAGAYPAEYRHITCPEPKKVAPRGVNHAQRHDPEDFSVLRTCECGTEWMVPRTSLASRRPEFVGNCCEGKPQDRHLKAVA